MTSERGGIENNVQWFKLHRCPPTTQGARSFILFARYEWRSLRVHELLSRSLTAVAHTVLPRTYFHRPGAPPLAAHVYQYRVYRRRHSHSLIKNRLIIYLLHHQDYGNNETKEPAARATRTSYRKEPTKTRYVGKNQYTNLDQRGWGDGMCHHECHAWVHGNSNSGARNDGLGWIFATSGRKK